MISLQKFNDFYLTRKIATGGMAEIFRAWKTGEAGFEKQVVIKRMLTHLTTNEDFLSMFLSEAKLVSKLTHANIAQVYDLGKNQESEDKHPTYFIAMEFVFGKNLAQIIKRAQEQKNPLPWECMAGVCLGAAQALEYAHELKDEQGRPLHIVHRDISPQNILITYSGEVKLVDFGIAKALVGRQQTQAGTLKGKLSYMSPEQAMGEAVDQRSDIYSLGIVLWELLTEHRLFTGDSEVGILQKVIKPQVADPTIFNSGIPRPLAQVCMNCLHSDRNMRYKSALDLIKDLNAYLQQLPDFSGTLALREHMHTLFAKDMVSEKEQIQEELQSVRQALASPGLDSSATVVIKSDGTLSIAPDQAATTVTGSAPPAVAASKTSLTISSKIMRLANSMGTMTRRAVALATASIVLLLVLVSIVAMWPEESGQGLQHSAPTIAAPSAIPVPTSQVAAPTIDQEQDEPSPTIQASAEHDQPGTAQERALATDQSKQVAILEQPPLAAHPKDVQAEKTTARDTQPASPPAMPPVPQPSAPSQVRAVPKPAPADASSYNPLADPNLNSGTRQFDQNRFDRLQSDFQQGQFAALDNKHSSGALEGRRIDGSRPPRIKASQADVTIRVWRQSGSALDVSILINEHHPSSKDSQYTITTRPIEIPVRLQSGRNTVRLVHGGTTIVEGILVQVDKGPTLSLSPGSQGNDLVIVEY